MNEQIFVRIGTDGTVTAETKGMKGAKCLSSLELLEQLLDARVEASAFTDEYQQSDVVATNEMDDELPQH